MLLQAEDRTAQWRNPQQTFPGVPDSEGEFLVAFIGRHGMLQENGEKLEHLHRAVPWIEVISTHFQDLAEWKMFHRLHYGTTQLPHHQAVTLSDNIIIGRRFLLVIDFDAAPGRHDE